MNADVQLACVGAIVNVKNNIHATSEFKVRKVIFFPPTQKKKLKERQFLHSSDA